MIETENRSLCENKNVGVEDKKIPEFCSLTLGQLIGRGGNCNVYEIKGYPDLVIRVFRSTWEGNMPMITELKLALDQVPEGVNTPKIVKVGFMPDGKAASIMERAVGQEIHNGHDNYETWSKKIKLIASVPEEHFRKLVSDIQILFNNGLSIDPSKPDNIFYDEALGFTFIDLSPKNQDEESPHSLVRCMLNTAALYGRKVRGNLNNEDRKNIEAIIEKMAKVGHLLSESDLVEIRMVANEPD
ncbi:MAG: hypothetical protein H6773_00625 [Pseudomonadales bacterium]|nr:hypothetical protein [Pseudomonadales bacterium]